MRLLLSSVAGLAGIILLVVSCPFLAAAAGIYYFTDYAVRNWPVIGATVTGLAARESYDSDTSSYTTLYCPVVAYKIEDGSSYEVETNECSFPAAYRTGDSVELYVNPSEPGSVRLKGGTGQSVGRILTIIFGVLGLATVLLGLTLSGAAVIGILRRRTT